MFKKYIAILTLLAVSLCSNAAYTPNNVTVKELIPGKIYHLSTANPDSSVVSFTRSMIFNVGNHSITLGNNATGSGGKKLAPGKCAILNREGVVKISASHSNEIARSVIVIDQPSSCKCTPESELLP